MIIPAGNIGPNEKPMPAASVKETAMWKWNRNKTCKASDKKIYMMTISRRPAALARGPRVKRPAAMPPQNIDEVRAAI